MPRKGVCDLRLTVAGDSEITARVEPSIASFRLRAKTSIGNATEPVFAVISGSNNAKTLESVSDCARLDSGKSESGLGLADPSPEGERSARIRGMAAVRRPTSGGAVAVLWCNCILSQLIIECGAVAVAVAGAVCNLQPMPLRLVYAATLSRVEGFTAGFGGESNVCK